MARASSRSKTSSTGASGTEFDAATTPENIIIPPQPSTPTGEQETSPLPVGEQLRRERERRNITIDAVAQMLKIRRVYLRAIEESNWAELPEAVYVNGFIRSYANFLGLNVLHTIPAAKTEIINLPSLPKLDIPKPIDDQQLPSPTTIILAVLGIFFLYALWSALHTDNDKPADPTPVATSTAEQNSTPAPTTTPTISNEPPLVESSDTASSSVEKAPAAAPTTYGASAPTRATITATQDSWIEIQTPDKHVVFSGVLRTGDSYRVPADPTLMFSSTNLSGLRFDLDGNSMVPPTDISNTLEQGLSLSPDHFLKPAAPSPAPVSTPAAKAPVQETPKAVAPPTHAAPKAKPHTRAAPPQDDEEDSTYDDVVPVPKNEYPSQRR